MATLAGGLFLAVIGGTIAGQMTVAGMASRSDYTIPTDGTEMASTAIDAQPVSSIETSPVCGDCSDQTGYATISLPMRQDDLPEQHLYGR